MLLVGIWGFPKIQDLNLVPIIVGSLLIFKDLKIRYPSFSETPIFLQGINRSETRAEVHLDLDRQHDFRQKPATKNTLSGP